MLSIKQEAVSSFLQSSNPWRDLSKNWPDDSWANFADSLINAVAIFGETEHFAREAERCQVLGIQKDREKQCNRMVKKRNAAGLDVLSDAGAALKKMKKRAKDAKVCSAKRIKSELAAFESDFADLLVDSQLKPSDVRKVQNVVEEAVSLARKKGVDGMFSLLEKNLDELTSLRKRDDRGAFDNVPMWKIVAVALFLGVAVIAIIHCLGFGCRGNEISYGAALLVLGLIALFC
ncbi:hypothetical protein [Enterovibrio paralichthyis]|uniref:hypothetical protein n=1 Tax=Enterovibrio paralichthyis TaxID=2853805 RepID=UPI001C460238|nr:hypothetical protein [Enterovibrio paralichthyis]MBV7296940.1 hypothetical protein [Enterovibrio paralichthyis]